MHERSGIKEGGLVEFKSDKSLLFDIKPLPLYVHHMHVINLTKLPPPPTPLLPVFFLLYVGEEGGGRGSRLRD